MKTIFGIKGWDLSEYAISANAILGIRDSGKTYTATEAAEELFDAGVPFIAFDPIGVWHSLRVPGRGKGYPVVVAGGKQADLPLTRKNAGTLVRAAMSAEVSLVLDLFSIEMTKSDWRAIVREAVEILLHENSEHGLRHIFIEEAAEFVPQRVQDGLVFAAVEKLVRMGGNSKLGCTLINQRSADLNKSVLELCANVFVHRQTGKNTLLDLKKWFEVMALDRAEQTKIADSLPDLKSGQCWAFINDLKKPIRLQVPTKNSQHPDRRAVTAKGAEKRKPVAADAFVAQMTAKLAEKEKIKAVAPLGQRQAVPAPAAPSAADARQHQAAIAKAREEGAQAVREAIPAMLDAQHQASFKAGFEFLAARRAVFEPDMVPARKPLPGIKAQPAAHSHKVLAGIVAGGTKTALAPAARTQTPRGSGGTADLTPPQRRVLASIGFWLSVGQDQPTRAQVGGVAGYSPSSGGFNNLLGQLNTAGLISIPAQGRVALAPGAPYDALDLDGAKAKVMSVLSNPERKLVAAMVAAGGGPLTRDDLGAATDYSPSSGGFNNLIGGLCTLTIFEKPAAGQVQLSAWAREVLG